MSSETYPGVTVVAHGGTDHSCPLPYGESVEPGTVVRCDTCQRTWAKVDEYSWTSVRADYCPHGHYVPR